MTNVTNGSNGGFTPQLHIPSESAQARACSPSQDRNGIVVFSGGSAANSLVDVFHDVAEARQKKLSYVIPISDNGGSSSELIRVFGGPGMSRPPYQ